MNQNKSETNRFHFGKIYKIIDRINGFYYLGETTSSLAKRFYEHKMDTTRLQSQKVYKYFNEIGFENLEIILVREVKCDNRDQLRKVENDEIEQCLDDPKCLNSYRAWTGLKTDDKKEYTKLYNEKFKQERRETYRKYMEENKEKLKKRREEYKEKKHLIDKKYRNNNKEKIKAILKLYYENNKQILKELALKQEKCICGTIYTHINKARHLKSQHHLKWLNNDQEIIKEYKCECGSECSSSNKNRHLKSNKHQQYIQQQESIAV